jgi:hypothetical protein
MSRDPEFLTHLEWLGYLQPVGLVVSAPTLAAAGMCLSGYGMRTFTATARAASVSVLTFVAFVAFCSSVVCTGQDKP